MNKEVFDNIRKAKAFNPVRWDKKCHNARQIKNKVIENCKHCSTRHPQRTCPAYGKICSSCGKTNHFKAVCRST